MTDVSSRALSIPHAPPASAASPAGSVGSPLAQSLQEQLLSLRLRSQDAATLRVVDKVLQTLQDVITGPGLLAGSLKEEDEAKWWECFADVFEQEVAFQAKKAGRLGPHEKRQILADILVWAEVTQEHYDQSTAQFVTQPHAMDESFQRIGRLYKSCCTQRGLNLHVRCRG